MWTIISTITAVISLVINYLQLINNKKLKRTVNTVNQNVNTGGGDNNNQVSTGSGNNFMAKHNVNID